MCWPFTVLVVAPLVAAEVALPGDTRLTYIGRFTHEGVVSRFGWAGTQIVARFSGPSVAANLSGSVSRFLAIIDGKRGKPFATGKTSGWETHVLAQDLPAGDHTLSLWKISEDVASSGVAGASAFGGFSAQKFLKAQPRASRRIEFIGDSDTAGFCADQKPGWLVDTNTSKYENAYETWAATVARTFDADMVEEAISGIGVETSTPSIQSHLDNILPFSSKFKWDFSSWVPDAVVFLIGPNDANPKSQQFIDDYMGLVNMVAKNYAAASTKPKLIHVCGGSINGLDPCASIQKVNDQFNKGRSDGFKGYYTAITADHWKAMNGPGSRTDGYKGCMGHYSPKGHELLAGDIIPQIAKIMGWAASVPAVVV